MATDEKVTRTLTMTRAQWAAVMHHIKMGQRDSPHPSISHPLDYEMDLQQALKIMDGEYFKANGAPTIDPEVNGV